MSSYAKTLLFDLFPLHYILYTNHLIMQLVIYFSILKVLLKCRGHFFFLLGLIHDHMQPFTQMYYFKIKNC